MTTPDSSVPRLVVVDDTDPTISYSPSSAFSLDSTGSLNELGNGGPAFNQTLTGTTTNASLSYTFNGTFVRAMVAAVGTTYTWNCTVDGHLITSFTVDTDQVTNYIACDSAGILQGTTGEHTLDVNLSFRPTNSSTTQSLWLDNIQYQPLPSDPLDSVMLRVHNSDPSVTYRNSSGGWSWQGFGSNSTQRTGTSMNLAFNGSSVTLYSVNFGAPTLFNASTAFYAIDSNSSVNFDLPGSAKAQNTGNYSNIINYPLFTASDLSTSPHNLEVATSYNSSSTPQYLTINYFIVKTNPANSTSPEQASNSSSTDSGSSSNISHKSVVASAMGGVIGGLVGLAGLLFLLYYLRRRKRNQYSGMMLDLTGGGPGYYRSNRTGDDTLEVTPFVSSAAPPGTAIPMKYTGSTAYTGQPSSSSGLAAAAGSSSSSSSNHPSRSSGWDSNRFVTSKYPRVLQVEDEQIRRSHIRQHEDSGVRMSSGENAEIDVPPTYTES
ncbi:hypothetical protein F5890DRAFT_1597576 [Lentinula detonsa]|uniref:Uncharacterized protein n=1 Tax=Lentinula detonsa TaxID=2804962 RepID=A0AA38PYP9_9AGAR|nr:hypothetical protein F5890DRAFT_1597576 [Lentinula detonsa]